MGQNGSGLAAVSSLDDPVRRSLYEFVSGSAEPVGRDAAAAAAGIGRPLAAYHLDKLVGLGLLSASYQRPAGRGGPGAGRPAKVYARSGNEFAVTVPPREYELAARLLAVAVESDRGAASRAALHDAAQQFGAGLGERSRAADPSGEGAPPGRSGRPARPRLRAGPGRRWHHPAAQLPVPPIGRRAPRPRLWHEPGPDRGPGRGPRRERAASGP